MLDPTPRYIKIGDAISQLINVAFLPNHKETTANESISGRAYRCGWLNVVKLIDLVFSVVEKEHCRKSYLADIDRARAMLEAHDK